MTGVQHHAKSHDSAPIELQARPQPADEWDPEPPTSPIQLPAGFPQQQRAAQSGPPYMPQYQQVAPNPGRNGFGITALCLGLVGLLFTLMPLTGFLAVILGGLALIFGLLGWARARRGQATNRKMAISGTVIGGIVTVLGIIGVVLFFQATAQFVDDMNQITGTTSSSSSAPAVPYSGVAAEPAAAKPTSYTYEVTGNYRATQLSFTDSNGDSVMLNNTGQTATMGSKLPWSKTVSPEPNGNFQSLNASTSSTKGDSWVTCTIKDNTGAVVATETGKGAYASCYASTPFS